MGRLANIEPLIAFAVLDWCINAASRRGAVRYPSIPITLTVLSAKKIRRALTGPLLDAKAGNRQATKEGRQDR